MDYESLSPDEIFIQDNLVSKQSKRKLFLKHIYDKFEKKKVSFVIKSLIILLLLTIITALSSRHGVYFSNNNPVRRYRIAHCMTGDPRTLYKEEVYTAYRREVLNKLPGDLFVVLQLMNKTQTIHGTVVTCPSPSRYVDALKYLSPREIEWIPVQNQLGATNDRSGYAKWKRCLEHIEKVEKQNNFKYDFIVRTRPDLYFAKELPSASVLPHDRILLNPYYECLQDIPSGYNHTWSDHPPPCDGIHFGLSDLFAIIPRKISSPYMNIAYTQNLPRHVCGMRADHPECAIRAALYKANITFEIWPFIVKIIRSADFCHLNAWNRVNSWC